MACREGAGGRADGAEAARREAVAEGATAGRRGSEGLEVVATAVGCAEAGAVAEGGAEAGRLEETGILETKAAEEARREREREEATTEN